MGRDGARWGGWRRVPDEAERLELERLRLVGVSDDGDDRRAHVHALLPQVRRKQGRVPRWRRRGRGREGQCGCEGVDQRVERLVVGVRVVSGWG
jgi:hypothetical protein